MKKIIQSILFVLVMHSVFGQPVLQWKNNFDFQSGIDIPYKMKVAYNGDIYVTGISNVDTFDNDILTLKINSDGTTAWHNVIRNDYGEEPKGLILDDEGNCYVGGYLGNIFLDESSFILRYNNNGSQAWIDTQGYSLQDIDMDSNYNVYTLSGGLNIVIVKHSSTGELLYEFKNDTNYIGHTTNPILYLLDKDFNMYVGGNYSETSNNPQFFLKKFTPLGSVLFDIKYNPTSDKENVRFMKVDDDGNVFMAGWIGTFKGIVIAKFNSVGDLLWDNVIMDVSGLPYDLILDADQNPILCGKVYEVHETTEFIIKKYDQDGNEMWVDYPGKTSAYFDKIAHLASDASGNIYFAGSTWPVYLAEPAFLMVKYDQSGNKLWEYKADSILSGTGDNVTGLALDEDNSMIVSIRGPGVNGKNDVITHKYAQLTGIDASISTSTLLNISPNPFHSTATVSYSTAPLIYQESTITLFDLFGREVSTASFQNNYQLDRTGIPNGMYLLKVVTSDGINSTDKVIIY
ncbi:MAG: T9SS type A sorting domain-containing protein [Chitinophagaceae bacterium]|nr:T9SS type A sorting domain-containing protein [Chitinophagaceae bacterium]